MVNGPEQWPLLPRPSGAPGDVSPIGPRPQSVRRQAPGYDPADPLRLSANFSNESRRGRWLVPPYVTAAPNMSSVTLDLRDAVPESDTIHLAVEGVAGKVVLIVPVGWGIDTDRLGKGIGSIHNRIGNLAVPGYPLVVVTGTVGLGSLVARRERFYERWGRGRRGEGEGPRELLR
ncbi:MAG TPA: hypothetical protein VIK31_14270 [Propionibacteriaceae bacterium]